MRRNKQCNRSIGRETPNTLNNIRKLIKSVRDYRRNCLSEVKILASLHELSAAQARLLDAGFFTSKRKERKLSEFTREKPSKTSNFQKGQATF